MSVAAGRQTMNSVHTDPIENILFEFSPTQQSTLSILVVDDSDADFALFKRCLNQIDGFKFEMAHASSPDAAKNLIRTVKFDLMFVDYWLGKETGVEFLRDLGGRQSECPLVLLSGMSNPDMQQVAMKAGAIGCMDKGDLNPRIVETTIRYSLHTHQLERKLMKTLIELNKANREKSRFFSSISNELTGPVQSVVDHAADIHSEAEMERATMITESARRLGIVVDNIIEYAFGGEDEQARDYVATDVRDIVLEAIKVVRPELVRREQNLIVLTGDAPLIAKIEHASFRQAVVNILSNANKFTPVGGTIRVTVGSDFHRVKVSVRDDGIGMSNREVTIALQPLGRIQLSDEHAQPGVGIGLPIVKAIMARHEGRLDIESSPNDGTQVELFLPQLVGIAAAE